MTGVPRNIDVESGLHLLVRVICCRVSYHRDAVAKLSGKSNCRFEASVRDEPHDDELLNAVPLELQIQIRIGKAARAPMLRGDDLAWLGHEAGMHLATPAAVLEGLVRPGRFL